MQRNIRNIYVNKFGLLLLSLLFGILLCVVALYPPPEMTEYQRAYEKVLEGDSRYSLRESSEGVVYVIAIEANGTQFIIYGPDGFKDKLYLD